MQLSAPRLPPLVGGRPSLPALPRLLVAGAVGWLGVTGGLGVLAWVAERPDLTRLAPGLPSMAPVTAVGLGLLALALWLVAPPAAGPVRRNLGAATGAGVAVLGAMVLGQYVVGYGTPLDQFLVPEAMSGIRPAAGRPSPYSATAFVGGGGALLLLDAVPPGKGWIATLFAQVPGLCGLTALLAYVFDEGYLRGLSSVVGLAVPAAVALLALTVGLGAARPDRPFVRALSSPGPGGTLARRLAPVLLAMPFGIGILARQSPEATAHADLAVTLATVSAVLGVAVLIAGTVRQLDRVDSRQRWLVDELRRQRDFQQALAAALHDGVVVLDPDWRVAAVNDRWCELTGRSREAMLGLAPPFPWTADTEPPDRADLARARMATGGHYDDELAVRQPDGTLRTVLASIAPVPTENGQVRHFLGTFKDITDRKETELAVARYAAELHEANLALADASQLKSDLMAMLGHELRQPLFVIMHYADLLLGRREQLAEEERRSLTTIDTAAQQLHQLLTDLLMMFALETRQITTTRHPVPLDRVVDQAVSALGHHAEVEVDLPAGLVVLADPGHLRQMLVNLLTNADKYGALPVRVTAAVDGPTVQVTVSDAGPGVPADFVAHLFDRFTRGDGTSGTLGTGLGLFILRRLADVNGGTVTYRPNVPHGSVFVIQLDAAPAAAAVR